MKLAVITDSSAFLSAETLQREDLFVLDIPVNIDGQEYVEGINLTAEEFYQKVAQASEFPKTSQPSIAKLDEILTSLKEQGYTHALGLFLSSGISGFYQNIQYMVDDYEGLTIAFPDTHITSAPLGIMVESVFNWRDQGDDFAIIQDKLAIQISRTSAFIMVDDLDHLVKGGRLSNGAAILGNLLSIKPILYFNDQGVIEVYEKVRTEKKATKRLIEIIKETTASDQYRVIVIHGNAPEKAEELRQHLLESGVATDISLATFGSVIGTHLGEGSIALSYTPIV
mgnify:FL=1